MMYIVYMLYLLISNYTLGYYLGLSVFSVRMCKLISYIE